MHRISASLKDGTVTAVLLVAKLQALDNKNLIHRGLVEYGRLLKTIVFLTFLSDKPYRRRIGRMLNKGEAVHSLARLIAYGQLGILTDRDLTSQLNRATCLSLLLNVIAVWNTKYMQAVLDHLRATHYPVLESDLEHLSPILSGPICMDRTTSTCRHPRSARDNCALYGRRNHSSDTWLNVVHRTFSSAVLGLSVVNFVGGPNRPYSVVGGL